MTKQQKCSDTQKNRIVIHKDNLEKRIYLKDLQLYLDKGWEKGISDKHRESQSESQKGIIPWNKGTKGIMRSNSSSWQKGHQPWNKGKKNVQKSWNKGLTKDTDDRIKKYSKKLKEHFSDEHRKICSHNGKYKKPLTEEKLKIKLSKEYITKKLNNSFNKSSVEEKFYKELLEQNRNKTIYRQYKDNRYPYYCDFYIKEDDLFIELNNHWTHGGKPYDENDESCKEQLKLWEEKAKKSQFFQNAIITWTIRDVEKKKCAERNKLNYKVIY